MIPITEIVTYCSLTLIGILVMAKATSMIMSAFSDYKKIKAKSTVKLIEAETELSKANHDILLQDKPGYSTSRQTRIFYFKTNQDILL